MWVVLPIRDGLWLCRRDGIGTHRVRELPVGPMSSSEQLADALQRVAVSRYGHCALFRDNTVLVLTPDGAPPVALPLPRDLSAVHAVLFRDDVLYIGGSSSWQDTSRLGWMDVSSPAPQWTPLDPPDVVGDPALPVFSLFASGSRLIALDGAFTPKLALIYDITDPRAPRRLSHTAVPSGLNDIPVGASLGRSYAAILTWSQHIDGKAWKIGLFDAATIDEVATFYEHSRHAEEIQTPRAVWVHEDLLLIAHDLKGLGVVRLDDRLPTRFEGIEAIRPWAQSYVPLERITYVKSLGQGRVADVRPTDTPHLFYIVLQRGGRTWWEEVELR